MEDLVSFVKDILSSALGEVLLAVLFALLTWFWVRKTRMIARLRHYLLRRPVLAVLLIVALGAGVLVGTAITNYLNAGRASRCQDLLRTAQQVTMELSYATDAGAAESLLQDVGNALEQAKELNCPETPFLELQSEALAHLDVLRGTVRLEDIRALVHFEDLGSNPQRLLWDDGDLYVLDRGLNRVIHYKWDSMTNGFMPGSTILTGQPGAAMRDIALVDALGRRIPAGLVALTQDGLLEYVPWSGTSQLEVTQPRSWQQPSLLTSWRGKLYVLDTQSNTILTYSLGGGTDVLPPRSYLEPGLEMDLTKAVDIEIDGFVYILLNDGGVLRLADGRPVPFSISGVPEWPRLVVAFDVSEKNRFLYLADSSTGSILRLGKDGVYVSEYRPSLGREDRFKQIRDISVDEYRGWLFVLTADSVLLAQGLPLD